MLVVNAVMVYGCNPEKFLQIVSADVQGGKREKWYKEKYQFRKAFSEYWINPELVTSGKESKKSNFEFEIPSTSTLSKISLLSPGTSSCTTIKTDHISKQRASRADDASLEHIGILSPLLSQSVDNIKEEAKKKPRCELQYWYAGIRYEGQILTYISYNISLCTKCYGLFHRV